MSRWTTLIAAAFVLSLAAAPAAANDESEGLVTLQSRHSVDETLDRLERALEDKGMTVFTRVDHADGAEKAGLEMQPTQVLVFGNPQIGTPIMQCARTAAIDFPQKALVWEDAEGQVWYAYNDPQYLVKRHNIEGCEAEVQKMTDALAGFAKNATQGS